MPTGLTQRTTTHGFHFITTSYYNFNIFNDQKRVEKLKYIHRNPVKRGLMNAPEHWKWSSHRCYALNEVGVVTVAEPALAKQFASHPNEVEKWRVGTRPATPSVEKVESLHRSTSGQ